MENTHKILQQSLDRASADEPSVTSALKARQKEISGERKRIVKELAKDKRKRKRILEKTKALSEAEMAAAIVARQVQASVKARADA